MFDLDEFIAENMVYNEDEKNEISQLQKREDEIKAERKQIHKQLGGVSMAEPTYGELIEMMYETIDAREDVQRRIIGVTSKMLRRYFALNEQAVGLES